MMSGKKKTFERQKNNRDSQQSKQNEDRGNFSKKENPRNESFGFEKLKSENESLRKANEEIRKANHELEKENAELKIKLKKLIDEQKWSESAMRNEHSSGNVCTDPTDRMEVDVQSPEAQSWLDLYEDAGASCAGAPSATPSDRKQSHENARAYQDERRDSDGSDWYEGHSQDQSTHQPQGKQQNTPTTSKSSWSHDRDQRNYSRNRGSGSFRSDDENYHGRGRTFRPSPNQSNDYGRRDLSAKFNRSNCKLNFIEKDGDLFTAPNTHSLAHCVAQDLRMGAGIAVTFKRDFKRVEELLGQRKKVGDVAVLEDKDNGRYIYYLITKKFSNGKPTLEDVESSLKAMRNHCLENGVQEVAMPRIACGLDRLHWREVRPLIKTVFQDCEMTITVYNFNEEALSFDDNTSTPKETNNPSAQSTKKTTLKRPSIYFKDANISLFEMESETAFVFFGSVNGDINDTIEKLDRKYCFVQDYKRAKKNLGGIFVCEKKGELIVGLIVKNRESEFISYKVLNDSLVMFRSEFKKRKYFYFGLEAFTDNDDDMKMTMEKIKTLLSNVFFFVRAEAWICWPNRTYN